jgi:hypothetical protein
VEKIVDFLEKGKPGGPWPSRHLPEDTVGAVTR